MVGSRTQTGMQRGIGKVRKARFTVMMLIFSVAGAIIFIDKKEESHVGDSVTKTAEVTTQKLLPTTREVAYETPTNTLPKIDELQRPLAVQDEPVKEQRVISPVSNLTESKHQTRSNIVAPMTLKNDSKSLVQEEVSGKNTKANKTRKTLKNLPTEEKSVCEAGYHVIQTGETLGQIAKKYYKNSGLWHLIYNANTDALKNPKCLKPGQKLKIPERTTETVAQTTEQPVQQKRVSPKSRTGFTPNFVATTNGNAAPDTTKPLMGNYRQYMVSRGDTLSSIAKKNGVSFLDIYECNPQLKSVNTLMLGMVIVLPTK